jgi:hypothetical protein
MGGVSSVAAAAPMAVAIVAIMIAAACAKKEGSPTNPTPTPTPNPTAAFTVSFGENPVPFRSSGCNVSNPQGWYTTARVQETAGVAFTPAALTQRVDGSVAGFLNESFASRFGACSGGTFTPGTIPANGAVCANVGVCTSDAHSTYQFQITGTDANGHAVTIDSPMLQLGAR